MPPPALNLNATEPSEPTRPRIQGWRQLGVGTLCLWLLAAVPAPPAVTVVRAERGSIAETVTLVGSLVPRDEVLVGARIDGLAITDILAEEGDVVARDQVLARLDRDALEAQAAQNRAQVARAAAAASQSRSQIAEAEANRVQTDAALGRARELVATGATSREAYEQKLATAQTASSRLRAAQDFMNVADADLALAQAQGRELAVKLARTAIRAPVAGTVSRRTARIGSVVSMSGDPLFRIIAHSAVELEGEVPEALLARLHDGEPAQVFVPGLPAPVTGRVRLVAPEVDRTTRLSRVRVALDQSKGLAIGGFARAVVETARQQGVIVPLSSVLFSTAGSTVQVVRDGTVETRPVTLGLRSGGRVEIADGLTDGEEVVSVSGTFIRHGDHVVAVRAAARTSSPAPASVAPVQN